MTLWKKILGAGLILSCIGLGSATKKLIKPFKDLGNKIELERIVEDTIKNPLRNLDSRYNYSEEELSKFNYWIDSTLTESALENRNSIIIDKLIYALYLIKNGEVDSKYNLELGFNPYFDKQREGDGCTPEGIYEAVWKRGKGQTVFYKAFLINYPNAEDKKKNKTGGAIEIHGCGSGEKGNEKGYNWTLGCMALSNEDIDKIFPYINKGDKITIVRYTNKNLTSKKSE